MMTTKEVSKKLFVCEATVRKYIRDGLGKENERLKAIKVNRGRRVEYRIKGEDLEAFRLKFLTNAKDVFCSCSHPLKKKNYDRCDMCGGRWKGRNKL